MRYFLTIANGGNEKLDFAYGYISETVDQCKEIVQEVAKEYGKDTNVPSNGWIPVEVELPKITNDYLVTKMCDNDENPIYETAHEIFWTIDGKWDCERDEYCDWKVIAWQNKIAPYQKGE